MPYRARCVSVACTLPERRMANAEFEQFMQTTDEWIVTRTGIRERRIQEPGKGLISLALPSCQEALRKAGVDPKDLDGIIVGTITGDYTCPGTANQLQHLLGARWAWGFDVANACNGFVAALSTAATYIEAGRAKRILVVGGDIMSTIVDFTDRATGILFGDGCGAVLIEAGDVTGPGIFGFELHSDGSGSTDLIIPSSGSAMPRSAETFANKQQFLKQNGRTVFAHAIRRMAEVCESLMANLGLTVNDIDLLVPHQANLRIIEPTAERLGLPMSKVMVNIDRVANTTAGTIPIALTHAEEQGRLKPGTRVMIVAFGGGLTWGATYLTWGR